MGSSQSRFNALFCTDKPTQPGQKDQERTDKKRAVPPYSCREYRLEHEKQTGVCYNRNARHNALRTVNFYKSSKYGESAARDTPSPTVKIHRTYKIHERPQIHTHDQSIARLAHEATAERFTIQRARLRRGSTSPQSYLVEPSRNDSSMHACSFGKVQHTVRELPSAPTGEILSFNFLLFRRFHIYQKRIYGYSRYPE